MPSTVSTSSVFNAVFGQKIKCFYALGYFRVFYVDSGYVKYSSSSNGSTWSTPQNVLSISQTYGQGLSVWTDGTYVYLAYGYGTALVFIRGTLNSDGTVTWGSAVTVDSNTTYHPSIVLDSNGYPWIAYHRSATHDLYVVKATAKDGSTWGTPTLLRDLTNYSYPNLVPLANGQLYLLYCVYTVNNLIGVLYNGSTWGSDETVATGISYYLRFQAVSNKSDKVYVAYDVATGKIYVNERTTSWGTAVLVTTRTEDVYPAITWISPDDLFVFWAETGTDHLYYIRRTGGSWYSVVDWIKESTDGIYASSVTTSSFTADSNYISCLYTTKLAAPFNVRFAYLIAVHTITLADSIGLLDTSQKAPAVLKADSIGLLDVYSKTWTVYRTLTDSVGLADAVQKAAYIKRTDSVGLLDTYSRVYSGYRTLADSIGLKDSVAPSFVRLLELSEKIALVDKAYKLRVAKFRRTLRPSRVLGSVRELEREREEPGRVE